jgi:predicted nucleotidyltransferase
MLAMTMKKRYYAIARELKLKLAKTIPLIDMRVFGSCARGDEVEDSDIDIFIEVENLTEQVKAKIREISWLVGLEKTAVISTLIFSRDELEHSPLRSSPVVENIMHEGIKI